MANVPPPSPGKNLAESMAKRRRPMPPAQRQQAVAPNSNAPMSQRRPNETQGRGGLGSPNTKRAFY